MSRPYGFTILEVIISLGIFGLLILGIVSLEMTMFQSNRTNESRAKLDQQSLIILHDFASELRTAQIPHDGSFPLVTATDTEVSFYSDVNGDGLIERVRYTVEAGAFKRGVIEPTGQPLTYDPGNESSKTLFESVVNDPPYFRYYDEQYDDTVATTSLPLPVNTSLIRVVEVRLPVMVANTLTPRIFNTSATVRTLRTH